MTLQLIEKITSNSCQWSNDRASHKRPLEVHEVDGITMVNVKLDALTKQLERLDMNVVLTSSCEMCDGDHASYGCQLGIYYALEPLNEQLNFLNYNQKGQDNPYSNTYNTSWREPHPNFTRSNETNTSNTNQNFRQPSPKFQARNINPQPLHHH